MIIFEKTLAHAIEKCEFFWKGIMLPKWYKHMKERRKKELKFPKDKRKRIPFNNKEANVHWTPQIEHCGISKGTLLQFDTILRYTTVAKFRNESLKFFKELGLESYFYMHEKHQKTEIKVRHIHGANDN